MRYFQPPCAFIMLLLCLPPAAMGSPSYFLYVNTSSIPSATAGFLDFEFQGLSTSPDGSGAVSTFSASATLTTPDPGNTDCSGGAFATGPLPADLTLCV